MNRILILIAFLATPEISADDYETATRFSTGDVISADVLNDILDRIELSLITPKSEDFLGSWDILQTTVPSGCFGTPNCTLAGGQPVVDNIYRQRTDSVNFTDDGDGTFRLNTSTYCPFLFGTDTNNSCGLSFAVVDGRFLINFSGARYAYNVQKISGSRFLLSVWATASQSFNIIQLDRQSLPPKSPTSLAIALTSTKASLTWTAGDTSETSYTIKRKSSAAASFSDLGTSTAESYEDTTIVKGNSYWYRVFANDADGTGLGSNVVRITYNNIPPSINLASTIAVNEGVTEVVDVRATDANGDALTYTIGSQSPSNDATNFSISSAGVISFNSAPDWENPSDYNTDNIYTINVSVSDGFETIIQDLSIVVVDVND